MLAVHDTSSGLWGALGLSRRANLMFKPLQFSSLSALIADFKQAYAAWDHHLAKVCALLSRLEGVSRPASARRLLA